jgi:formate/nitrite transporter FocA (FNT family)
MSKPDTTNKENADQPKGVNDILDEQIYTATLEYKRLNKRLFVSSLSAGLEIGFSIFFNGRIIYLVSWYAFF